MKIFYITDICITGYSGKEKGTRTKIDCLKKKLGKNFIYFSPKYKINNSIINLLYLLLNDLILCLRIVLFNRNYIFIERSSRLVITNYIIRLFEFPVFSEVHADVEEEISLLDKPLYQKLLIQFLWKINLWNYSKNLGIFYNHPYVQNHFSKKITCPSIAVYNGAATDEYYPMNKNECRKTFNIDVEKIIFIFIGSGSKWHGLDYLISIFNSQNMRNRNDIKLLVVGPSVQRVNSIKESVKGNNIIFINEVDNSKAVKLINASDICLLPVKNNRISPGSPIKLYDYAACGKAIIAQQKLHGYFDEVLNHNLGIVVDFSEAKEASDTLLNFIDNYDPNFYMKNNRWMAENRINVNNRIDSWLEFITSIIYG